MVGGGGGKEHLQCHTHLVKSMWPWSYRQLCLLWPYISDDDDYYYYYSDGLYIDSNDCDSDDIDDDGYYYGDE